MQSNGLLATRPNRDDDVLLVLPPDAAVGTAHCLSRIIPDRRGGAPTLFLQLRRVRWNPDYALPMDSPNYRLRFPDGIEVEGFLDTASVAVTARGIHRFTPTD
jgi:hypothetical protein